MVEETKKELIPRSFRIADDTYQQLKEISGELSGNQDEVFSQLIRVFQMEKGKSVLPERKKEIEDFQNYTELLTKLFLHSLEDYAVLEEKIALKYEERMNSKDETIIQLQRQIDTLKKTSDKNTVVADKLRDDNISLSQELEHTKKALANEKKRNEQTLNDKDILIQELKEGKNKANEQLAALSMELSVAQTQLGEIDNLNATITTLKEKHEKTEKELEQTKQLVSDTEKELEETIKSYDQKLSLLKENSDQDLKNQEAALKAQMDLLKNSINIEKQSALLDLEKSHKKELEVMESKYTTSIEKLQVKYELLLEKLENTMGLTQKSSKE